MGGIMYQIKKYTDLKVSSECHSEFIDAAEKGNITIIRQCLDIGVSPDTNGPDGWPVLQKAVAGNHLETAYMLLNQGATVDSKNPDGHTALMIASRYDYHDMIAWLLLYGADLNIINNDGQTALMIAATQGHTLSVGILLEILSESASTEYTKHLIKAHQLALQNGHDKVAKLLRAVATKTLLITEQVHMIAESRMRKRLRPSKTGAH